ncbi:hypothetical protein [Wolbachia endosymbiont of Armadillidium arcangelii]|uniref:Uncharacterized protein n=1 Tax=Wolbachia endosymbiont of Armadillidium arcangelii TaxID=3158571 RepID=A0AAU7Q120_9RICK
MPNTSEINQELVKAFNSILRFSDAVVTNCTVEVKSVKRSLFPSKENHIVLSFDKNMDINQRKKYLSNMKEKVIERFCPDETILDDCFYTKFFPFNFDQVNLTKDNKLLVPMGKKVVSNLKFLLANELARYATSTIIKEEDLNLDDVDDNIVDEVFDKGSYLYGAECHKKSLQDSFVEFLSSRIIDYENGPKKTKDFLQEKGNYVYIKKSVFDNPELIKDIVKDEVSVICRCFQVPSAENKMNETLKFAVVDLIRKALPHLPINSMWHTSHKESKDEFSILAPIVDCGNYIEFLNEKEINHINNEVFGGKEVLRDLKNDIAERGLPTYGVRQIYAIDFANPDIAYCVMDKIIESSVINKDHQLSIDPARVPKLSPPLDSPLPKTLPQEREDRDSGIETTPPKPKGSAACSSSDSSPEKDSTSLIKRFSMKRQSPKRKQPESTDISDGMKKNNRDSGGVHFLESSGKSCPSPDSKLESSTTESRARVPVGERDFSE